MPRDQDRKPAEGLIDTLANLVGEIVTDARQRVVEEGWFGRPVTAGSYDDHLAALYSKPVEAPEQDSSREQDIER